LIGYNIIKEREQRTNRMKDKVFDKPMEKKFEFDVKSVSKQQLLVVCSFGTGVVGTKCSHRGLLSDDGILS